MKEKEYTPLLREICPAEGLGFLEEYFKLVESAEEVEEEYGEWHHILPSSLFPKFKERRLFPWNQKRVTAEAHFMAHYLLYKALRNKEMRNAWVYVFLMARKDKEIREEELDKYAGEYAEVKKQLNREIWGGKTVVKDSSGKTFMISVNDPRFLSGELKSANSGKFLVVDPTTGKRLRIDKTDPSYISGELRGIHSGTTIYVNATTGECIGRLPASSPKLSPGEFITLNKYLHKTGRILQGSKNLSKHNQSCRGKKWYNNGIKSKQFSCSQEAKDLGYLNQGRAKLKQRTRPPQYKHPRYSNTRIQKLSTLPITQTI